MDADIEKVLVFLAKKPINTFLVTCINDRKVKPLHIMLPKASAYVEHYDGQTKQTQFLIKGYKLLEKYTTMFGINSALISKRISQ